MGRTNRSHQRMTPPDTSTPPERRRASDPKRRAERDIVALGISVTAVLLFVGTGGTVLPQIARSWFFGENAPDLVLINALLLNIALVVFGMRRYRELLAEVAERRNAEKVARELAETDPLTGCLNRRSIIPATAALLAQRDSGVAGFAPQGVAMLMIDLDNFKQVNDLNGHQVGDTVLRSTADRMRSTLSASDAVARIGGDEFAVALLYDTMRPEQLDLVAGALIDSISRQQPVDGLPVETTISLGIATTEAIAADPDEAPQDDAALAERLMHRADIAMYHAKKQGKNCHARFEPAMETELRHRSTMEAGIRHGLANGEFVPYYEQQIDIETGAIVGFEMLARWQSAEHGLVAPTVFIPVAEAMGVIGTMSEQLIATAMQDALGWAPHLTLSVNISPVQLRDPWFAQKLLKLLVTHNFPPQRLEVEITESCLHHNIGQVRAMITSLKNQGVQISLDDFGTGFSSLAQLRALPFDRLKIDRSFVGELNAENGNQKLIEAIIALGEGLGLPITAEGIEDGKILKALRGKGQLKGQGYLYGRPETANDVAARLADAGLLNDTPAPGANPAVGGDTQGAALSA